MKKYISLLLATAATIACTKVALEDNRPIESLPQDGNTENVQGEPSGEKIIISLAETKVSLDGNGYYQFDGDEVIYVKARTTEAVAKLQNSADEKNTFTGVFNGLLGKDSETFDFYYNCTDENANVVTDEKGNVVKVQNGQPWLAATGVPGNRSEGSEYSYELSDVKLNQLGGYVCLALNSGYPCTVDFHTLTTALPNGETTITGIQFGSGNNKPYFVNIKSGMTGGFYLTVTNPKGQKMYTSYGSGSSASIEKNTSVKVKGFTPMNISGSLTGFETTYDLYKTKGADAANSESNDYMAGGNLKISVQGISNSLLSLDSITITSSDGKTIGSSTSQPEWSNKEYTWNFNDASKHTTWGELTVTATAVFNTPAGQVTAEVPALSRHITGLPYRVNPPSNSGTNKWTAKNSNLVSTVNWKTTYVHLEGISKAPEIVSPSFHIPDNLPFSAIFDILIHSRKPTFSWGSWMYPTFTAATKVGTILTQEPKAETEDCTYKDINGNATFTTSANTISLKSSQATTSPYIRVSRVDVIYRDE